MLRQYIAPVISANPEKVSITQCYWGDVGAYFRFQGASMPASPINNARRAIKGKAVSEVEHFRSDVNHVRSGLKKARIKAGLIQLKGKMKARATMLDYHPGQLLHKLKADGLSDLALHTISKMPFLSSGEKQIALLAADEIAEEIGCSPQLKECRNIKDEIVLFQSLLRSRYLHLRSEKGLPELKQKPEWLNAIGTHLIEGLERYSDVPGFLMTRAAAEVRSPINALVTSFIGDVFTYIRERGTSEHPGPIPQRALAALVDANCKNGAVATAAKSDIREPLIVLTHSMGGQIMYDLVTHFLPSDPGYADVYIDFWCASASQIGFFEELKLFLASDESYSAKSGQRVPLPDKKHLGYWWNVWDHNDFISYSAKNVFDGVEDAAYNTGMFLIDAHGGYLVRPSFFRQFATKLKGELEKKATGV